MDIRFIIHFDYVRHASIVNEEFKEQYYTGNVHISNLNFRTEYYDISLGSHCQMNMNWELCTLCNIYIYCLF